MIAHLPSLVYLRTRTRACVKEPLLLTRERRSTAVGRCGYRGGRDQPDGGVGN
jgi:hypothetical protein